MNKKYSQPEFEVIQLMVKDILNGSFDEEIRNEVLVDGNGLYGKS